MYAGVVGGGRGEFRLVMTIHLLLSTSAIIISLLGQAESPRTVQYSTVLPSL